MRDVNLLAPRIAQVLERRMILKDVVARKKSKEHKIGLISEPVLLEVMQLLNGSVTAPPARNDLESAAQRGILLVEHHFKPFMKGQRELNLAGLDVGVAEDQDAIDTRRFCDGVFFVAPSLAVDFDLRLEFLDIIGNITGVIEFCVRGLKFVPSVARSRNIFPRGKSRSAQDKFSQ